MRIVIIQGWKLTWVHCYEDTAGPDEHDFSPLKHEPLRAGRQGTQDRENLLGDHGQHLNVDTVELVKATPGSSLKQTAPQYLKSTSISAISSETLEPLP